MREGCYWSLERECVLYDIHAPLYLFALYGLVGWEGEGSTMCSLAHESILKMIEEMNEMR